MKCAWLLGLQRCERSWMHWKRYVASISSAPSGQFLPSRTGTDCLARSVTMSGRSRHTFPLRARTVQIFFIHVCTAVPRIRKRLVDSSAFLGRGDSFYEVHLYWRESESIVDRPIGRASPSRSSNGVPWCDVRRRASLCLPSRFLYRFGPFQFGPFCNGLCMWVEDVHFFGRGRRERNALAVQYKSWRYCTIMVDNRCCLNSRNSFSKVWWTKDM